MTDVDLTKLRDTGAKFQALRAELDQARGDLRPLILEALEAGVPQRTVGDLTGLTREAVRQLARANGIESKR